jgi:hypothetical protein
MWSVIVFILIVYVIVKLAGKEGETSTSSSKGLRSGLGDSPEQAERAVLGSDEAGTSSPRALSPEKLPGPKPKAEIRGVRSQAPLRLVAASLPLRQEVGESGTVPRVFQFDGRRIAEIRERVGRGDWKLDDAVERLRCEANRWLTTKPPTVVHKPDAPPSDDKHDYWSFPPYFSRDDSKPDGKSYILKDGVRNKDEVKKYDAPRLVQLNKAALTLALAYALTDDREKAERYAKKAASFLRAWFLDPKTRMNPNLNFGQLEPGQSEGRHYGIIETRGLVNVVDAAGLIEGSPAWTAQDGKGLRDWFREYLNWLRKTRLGKDEEKEKNNHGTWYDVQVVTFALYVGEDEAARQVLERSKKRRIEPDGAQPEELNRIAHQIETDGKQLKELKRSDSFHYCAFNLDAFATLADLGGKAGVDLWHEATDDGRSITKALDFMVPYATGKSPWPPGYDLRLMSRVDGRRVPISDSNLVIVRTDNDGRLHIRIFDATGKRVTDTDETKLPSTQAGAIRTLKQRLPGLLPPHVLTDAEKAQVIREATSIVGQTPWPYRQDKPVEKDDMLRMLLPLRRAAVAIPNPGYEDAFNKIVAAWESPDGSDLRLMSWEDGTGVPTPGQNLIIVGTDNNGRLHIRIFDSAANPVTGTDETKLPATQAGAIATLKQRIPGLLPPHILTSAEKTRVISEAKSIVGRPDFIQELLHPPGPAKRRGSQRGREP